MSEARVGDEVVYSAVIRDVTERLAVEEELRRQRDLAQGILDAAQAIVLLLDTDGRIVEYNAYFEELSGYRLEEVRGRDWFQTFLPEADRPRIRRLFFQVLGEGLIRGNVNPIVTRAGDLRLIEWHARTLHDAKGHCTTPKDSQSESSRWATTSPSERPARASKPCLRNSALMRSSNGTSAPCYKPRASALREPWAQTRSRWSSRSPATPPCT